MPDPEDSQEWPARLTRVIAREITRHRKARGMSVQALSEAVEALGVTIQRPVLSNLENGRRHTISVAEWLVIAAALGIPPAQLLAPAGFEDELEVLPGVTVPTYDALLWLRGTENLQALGRGGEDDFAEWLYAYEEAEHGIHDLLDLHREAQQAGLVPGAPGYAEYRRHREAVEKRVLRDREDLRGSGRTPPPLPSELAHLEDGGTPRPAPR